MQRYQISLDTNFRDTDDGSSTVVQSPTDVEKEHGKITNFKPVVSSSTDDFPDGGLRAWLIVCGVGISSSRHFVSDFQLPLCRQCVTHLLRKRHLGLHSLLMI